MLRLTILMLTASLASGATIVANPIAVTGSGWWSASTTESVVNYGFSFSGTNADGDTIALSTSGSHGLYGYSVMIGTPQGASPGTDYGMMNIDDARGSHYLYSFAGNSFTGMKAYAEILDQSWNVLAIVNLSGLFTTITTGSQGGESWGTLTITSPAATPSVVVSSDAPEPSGVWLLLAGWPMLWLARKRS